MRLVYSDFRLKKMWENLFVKELIDKFEPSTKLKGNSSKKGFG